MKREIVEDIKVLTSVNGVPVTSFEDQRDNAVHLLQTNASWGERKMNPDGTVARSRVVNAAINVDVFYDNRYRLFDDQIEIVSTHTTDGYRIIDEVHRTGRCPFKQVNVFVLKREGNELKLVGKKVVSDTEFTSDFTHKLNKEAMRQILPIIFFTPEVDGEDKLPI